MGRFRLLSRSTLLALVSLLLAASGLAAQGSCGVTNSTLLTRIAGAGGEILYLADPVLVCNDGTRITADSAIVVTAQNVSQLIGNVRFRETERTLTADLAHYYSREERLNAWGRVVLVDAGSGSTVRGDQLVYFRAGVARAESDLRVTGGRPSASVQPGSSGDTLSRGSPWEVVADRIDIPGEQTFRAYGRVEIVRDALRAFGDSVLYDGSSGELDLLGNARSEGDRFTMTGGRISLALTNDEVSEVVARDSAQLVSDDLTLTAPLIRVFVEGEAMHRLVASLRSVAGDPGRDSARVEGGEVPSEAPPLAPGRRGRPAQEAAQEGAGGGAAPSQPVATSLDFRIRGDSIDVSAPGEVLESITAIGRARGQTLKAVSAFAPTGEEDGDPDSLIDGADWMEGDTIIALFRKRDALALASAVTDPDSLGVSDEYELVELWARGNAKSLYRMQAADTVGVSEQRAIHYVVGVAIRIVMIGGEVDRMEVEGPTRGLHLEPSAQVLPPADTGAALASRHEAADSHAGVDGGGAGARGVKRPSTGPRSPVPSTPRDSTYSYREFLQSPSPPKWRR